MARLLLFCLFLAAATAYNWIQPNLGRYCRHGETGRAGLKYYHDSKTFESFPFFYRGCGGDNNRYDNRSVAPMIMDYSPCPGYPENVGECGEGEYDYPIPPEDFPHLHLRPQPKTCPPTAYCSIVSPWGGHGECCDSGAAVRAAKNREAPQCKALGRPVVHEKGGEILLGRNCSHQFCPFASSCFQGEFYAYCCHKPIN